MHTRNEATGEKVSQPRVINQPDPRIPGSTFWAWIISDFFFPMQRMQWLWKDTQTRAKSAQWKALHLSAFQLQQTAWVTEIVSYEIDGAYVDPANLVVFQIRKKVC
jgi:hypothetical protein